MTEHEMIANLTIAIDNMMDVLDHIEQYRKQDGVYERGFWRLGEAISHATWMRWELRGRIDRERVRTDTDQQV